MKHHKILIGLLAAFAILWYFANKMGGWGALLMSAEAKVSGIGVNAGPGQVLGSQAQHIGQIGPSSQGAVQADTRLPFWATGYDD